MKQLWLRLHETLSFCNVILSHVAVVVSAVVKAWQRSRQTSPYVLGGQELHASGHLVREAEKVHGAEALTSVI